MPKRIPIPMVTTALDDSPAARQLNVIGFGAYMRLALHLHATGYAPLPAEASDLAAIARVAMPTWLRHRALIIAAIEAWRPAAASDHDRRLNHRAQLSANGFKGAAVRTARASKRRLEASAAARQPDITNAHQLSLSPQRERPPANQYRPPAPADRPKRAIRSDSLKRS